jgi:hypothetical protein
MPFSEFLEWLEYLKQEQRATSKSDWYLAQIASEVRRSFVAAPNKVKLADFLLNTTEVIEEAKEKAQKSKAAWAAFLQLDISKKN